MPSSTAGSSSTNNTRFIRFPRPQLFSPFAVDFASVAADPLFGRALFSVAFAVTFVAATVARGSCARLSVGAFSLAPIAVMVAAFWAGDFAVLLLVCTVRPPLRRTLSSYMRNENEHEFTT
jgi:hypothetical protein